MRFVVYFFIILFTGCSNLENYKVVDYYEHINLAELAICSENFKEALQEYKAAFDKIEKPFGKDVYNAALVSQLSGDYQSRNIYLQDIINNSNNLGFVRTVFIKEYMSAPEWDALVAKRKIRYDKGLREEFEQMYSKDQIHRPMYETHDDTINSIRKINLNRILEITNSQGFPSHIELGYSNNLRNQPHHIVLYHTAQRRSYDKSVVDLEPIFRSAVEAGRLDPEIAILYLNFQNDREKEHFEVYSSWQHKHPLLPDSLNNKVWFPNLDKEQKLIANKPREKWYANSIEDIALKVEYLNKSNLPFVFTSIRKSIGLMRDDLTKEEALEQYEALTRYKVEQ